MGRKYWNWVGNPSVLTSARLDEAGNTCNNEQVQDLRNNVPHHKNALKQEDPKYEQEEYFFACSLSDHRLLCERNIDHKCGTSV